ncbi:MAG: LVIVD repeat-containing protein, partial [Candidatus Hodarchaeales archaeon]
MNITNLIFLEASEIEVSPKSPVFRGLKNSHNLSINPLNEINTPIKSSTNKTNSFSYVEEFNDMDYQNVTATNASGWGTGRVSLGIGGLNTVSITDLGSAHDIHVCGNFAYVAAGGRGLAIIDISDPTNPGEPLFQATTGITQGIYVQDDFAYLAIGYSGLAIINISDPTNPGIPIYQDTTGNAQVVFVSGNFTYLALWEGGLAIINTSDPTNPGSPYYRDTDGYACDIHVHGDFAYVADHWNGLAVINISDPTNPSYPAYNDVNYEVWSVYIRDNHAYTAIFERGLAIFDISNPTNLSSPIYRDIQQYGYPLDVYVYGDFAYLAASNIGSLAAINISDPLNPGIPIYKSSFDQCSGVFVSNNYVYVTHSEFGFMIVESASQASLSTAQSTSFYQDGGFVQNVTLFTNQTVFVNTSIDYQISTNGKTWIPITPNETHIFVTNPSPDLHWRVILMTVNHSGQSPYVASIRINFDVYYDEESPLITLTNVQNSSRILVGTIIECVIQDFTLIRSWFNWDNGTNLILTD